MRQNRKSRNISRSVDVAAALNDVMVFCTYIDPHKTISPCWPQICVTLFISAVIANVKNALRGGMECNFYIFLVASQAVFRMCHNYLGRSHYLIFIYIDREVFGGIYISFLKRIKIVWKKQKFLIKVKLFATL